MIGEKMDLNKTKWNIEESTILLDNYLKYLDGNINRKDAIQITSNELRKLALNKGIPIDNTFRNENGITFQMHSMESAYQGHTIFKPASNLFIETVNLYNNNRAQFINILESTREKIQKFNGNSSESFYTWLQDKVGSARTSEFNKMYNIVNDFCMKKNLIDKSFLDIRDLYELKKIKDTIEQNRIFKFQNRLNMKKIRLAMDYYTTFVKEKNENIDPKFECPSTDEKTEIKNNNNSYDKVYQLDFNDLDGLSLTIPVEVLYFNQRIEVEDCWDKVYINLFKKLYKDYTDKISLNESFGGLNKRMDFCTSKFLFSMSSPKLIAEDRYLETNLSVTDMICKLKNLLNLCFVDKENVIIKYKKKKGTQPVESLTNKQTDSNSDIDIKERFSNWLVDEKGMARSTSRTNISAINTAERYAKKHGFSHCVFFTYDYNEALLTKNELFNDNDFVFYNDLENNRFKTSIDKFLLFLDSLNREAKPNDPNDIIIPDNKISDDLAQFKKILSEKFSKGFRMNSIIELKKFKQFWEMKYESPLDMDEEMIKKQIKECGIIYEEKLYLPESMLDDVTKEKLFLYIKNTFSSGVKVIFFEALFNKFSDDFLGQSIFNADMLHAYLKYMSINHQYYIKKNYITVERGQDVDPYDEVRNCLIQQNVPVESSYLFEKLSYIPKSKIKTILATNAEFVTNGRNEYFHVSISYFSEEDLENISTIIQQAIDERSFISGNELINSIKRKFPNIIEQNSFLSDLGLRGAICYKLKDKYSFEGNIISVKGQKLSMANVFSGFCRARETFTLNELKKLKQELNTIIYFDVIYENSLRISKDQFVSKEQAAFLPEATDRAIERFCTGQYISISKIDYFGTFPDAGFKWNSFLLEHYVADYSKNFKLIHLSYNEGVCVGAIVKKTSRISDMDELIIDVLANSNIQLQKDEALDYLCEEGYLARRRYSNIEQLLIKAKELRNQKGL